MSSTHFYWFIGIVVTFLIPMFAFFSYQILNLNSQNEKFDSKLVVIADRVSELDAKNGIKRSG